MDRKLFPYLHGFKQRAAGPNTIEYKIGEIFGEIKNKIRSGYTRRRLLDGLAEKGFGHDQLAEMQKIIDAEKSDIFDVLAHVAYAEGYSPQKLAAVKSRIFSKATRGSFT